MLAANSSSRLDYLYVMLNSIYLDRNYYRDASSIFAHLVEVVGGLSLMASEKTKPGVEPDRFVPKALAWWFALCGKLGVRSVEEMLWIKFPRICPYCQKEVHVGDICAEIKQEPMSPDWGELERVGKQTQKPDDLPGWQRMFGRIYPVGTTEKLDETFARIVEELGELSESLRVFNTEPAYFLSEAPDVFAWLMHLQNLIDLRDKVPVAERGNRLVNSFLDRYPNRCTDCGYSICICPPVLPSTLGRIAREVPASRASVSQVGVLLPIEDAIKLFELRAQSLRINGHTIPVDAETILEIRRTVKEMQSFIIEKMDEFEHVPTTLFETLESIEELTAQQRVTQASIQELITEIADLPSEERNAAIGFLTTIAASPWSLILADAIRSLAA